MKYNALKVNSFGKHIVNWYLGVKRPLPWRETNNPYAIWVSEIILQQTRVEQGLPFYHKFLENFPTVFLLADASEMEVLKIWQGLGDYSRARNMHKCSKIIVQNYSGEFPKTFEELLTLPGIGRYTAAAISSFAFKLPVPAIDGNVIRVLTRIYRIRDIPTSSKVQQKLFSLSKQLIPKSSPDLYNQAMMELGATVCKPVKPHCIQCPVIDFCEAHKAGDQQKFPRKKPRAEIRKRYFNYVILKSGDKTYFQLREGKDIWKGLYEFLLVESNKPIDVPEVFNQIPEIIAGEPEVEYESREFKHQLSHQEIRARFIELRTSRRKINLPKSGKMFNNLDIEDLPKSVLISNYLEERPI